ncbi:hypothetical protein K523DRAFT_325596 [Schizophyllum commune Tattone D]|nr:hypothetical protein K523DRAFT_325596 [Schizophyllum commune Tattone D]
MDAARWSPVCLRDCLCCASAVALALPPRFLPDFLATFLLPRRRACLRDCLILALPPILSSSARARLRAQRSLRRALWARVCGGPPS